MNSSKCRASFAALKWLQKSIHLCSKHLKQQDGWLYIAWKKTNRNDCMNPLLQTKNMLLNTDAAAAAAKLFGIK